MKIVDLRCCLFDSPVGLHSKAPEFSWSFSDPCEGSSHQRAWRIIVAQDEKAASEGRGSLWDSGWQLGAKSSFVRYAGAALRSGEVYYWKVFTRDESDHEIASQVAFWSAGLLDASDWVGQWIGKDAPAEYPVQPFAGASWIWDEQGGSGEICFEKRFHLEKETSAVLWGLADDQAEILINERPVCDLLRAQAGTNLFPLPLPIDVMLSAGENRVLVQAHKRPKHSSPGGVILRMETPCGFRVVTDSSWRCSRDGKAGQIKVIGNFGTPPWDMQSVREYPNLPARYVRREFSISRAVRRAVVYFSGLGISELWLNGAPVGEDVLSPHISDFSKNYYYRAYDVTEFLRKGENAIGCILGNGRFFAPRVNVPLPMQTYGCPKLRLQLEIEHVDGSSSRIVSDEAWKISVSGALGWNNEFDGEHYDARKADKSWALPSFEGKGWSAVDLVAAPEGVVQGQTSHPIRMTERISPQADWLTKYGTRIYDFGCNLTGWCNIVLSGTSGTRVLLRHAETLESRDVLSTENLRSALCTDTIILREGLTCYAPRFTYHGFRYVEVRGNAEVISIEACFLHDDVPTSGSFHCSDALVNSIVEVATRGIRGNYHSVPTDCPQRDERMGWLGDRAGGAPNEMFLFDVSQLYRKWLEDIRLSQTPSGCVPDVAPAFWRIYSDNVTWPSGMVFLPHALYWNYGDTAVVREHYGSMREWLRHLCEYLNGGLISRDCYGDWCVPPEAPHLIHSLRADKKTNPVLLASCYMAMCLKRAAELAHVVGEHADAALWLKTREAIKLSINKRFFDSARNCYDNGSQTAALLPLAFDLVPEDAKQKVFDFLVSSITQSGTPVLGTGLIGGHWLLRTLTAFGRVDIARDLVCRQAYPSWGYMVAEGATTIWELWNGNTADPLMNSGNHVMLLGDLITWLFKDIAGIQAMAPGFSEIRLRPHFIFESLSCSYESIHGRILSEWRTDGGKIEWTVEIPANTSALLELPRNLNASVKNTKQRKDSLGGALRVGPGRHAFRFVDINICAGL